MKHCRKYVVGLIACVAVLAVCASTHDKIYAQQMMMPPNAESEYLKTVSVGIFLNGHVTPTEISYAIRLKVRKPVPQSAILVLKFENPDPQAAPLEVVYVPKSDQKEIFVVSPSVACIVNGRLYRVVVTLFADHERRDILGTHEQMVAFSVQPMILIPICIQDDTMLYFRHGGMPWRDIVSSYLKKCRGPGSYAIEQPRYPNIARLYQ
jgi:hypothetical protein